MRGIKLWDSIKLFGVKDALGFWFRWSFIDPIQIWYWLNISHKPYCTEHGWVCKHSLRNTDGCNAKKLTTKKEILAHWASMDKEINEVEVGAGGMCVYCGKRKAKVTIPNPNMDKLNSWKVCLSCDEIIKIQQELTMAILTKNNEAIIECQRKLRVISEEIGEEIISLEISK